MGLYIPPDSSRGKGSNHMQWFQNHTSGAYFLLDPPDGPFTTLL